VTDHESWAKPLVDRLTDLARPESIDRETLAHLRRGLCGPADSTLARVGWLFRRVPDDATGRALDSAVLAAGLFAWVKGNCPQNDGANFGRAFGAGLSDEDKQQREKRFTDLLDTDLTELPYKLRQAVALIEGTGLDWVTLIKHLIHWDHPDRWVQKDWARGFWSGFGPDAEPDATATN
jgi:CRISPR system Cascade subunit CasB